MLLFLSCYALQLQAQQRFTISGNVTEASSNEFLIGVTVAIPELNTGVVTNEYGFYSLTLSAGNYEILISYLGYDRIVEPLALDQDKTVNFQLIEKADQLEEVVISGEKDPTNIGSPQMSINELSIQSIRNIPVALGEADVIKSLLMLPGVTNAGETSSGFNVRGGAADQNLILLDEATIYNPSHLFGFFSVFNTDAIKDVKLYKGGIPAKYGGRISSVLDIHQKEGNSKDLKVRGGIGATAGRLMVEGPLKKEKSSFLLAGRSSYAHLYLPLFDFDNSAFFYDLNSKFTFRLNQNNKIFFSGYLGRDAFTIDDNFTNEYGNSVVNFRWNHLFSQKLFSNLSLIYSGYDAGLKLEHEKIKWTSAINNFNIKYDLKNYINDRLQLNYGINNIYYHFDPGKVSPNGANSGIVESDLIQKYANELSVYIDIEQGISDRLNLQYGLRLSHFMRLGQDSLNLYKFDDPLFFDPFLLIYLPSEPIKVTAPGRGGVMKRFTNLEPRLSLSYSFNPNTSLKASYTRMAQYLHLLSNTSAPTPVDVWAPSGPYAKPQILDQFALGLFKKIDHGKYSFETEGFYKQIDNRLDYIDGADLIANNAVEQIILEGEARSYGWEFLFRKNQGKFQGWLAYTLSHSEQRTPGRIPKFDNGRSNLETGINLGRWYNNAYDKTHDLSVYASFKVSKFWSLNANFIFQTGQPTNYPIGQFEFFEQSVPYFGERNRIRLPDYHRLDFSATFTPSRSGKKIESEWVFSIYNLYNRVNTASINFRRNLDSGENEAIRTSIFGIVPTLTYNFKF